MDVASKALRKRLYVFSGGLLFGALIVTTVFWVFMAVGNFRIFFVTGDSMEPTLSSQDTVLLKQAKTLTPGQIVLFSRPAAWDQNNLHQAKERTLVKRVVAVPGQTFTYRDEKFFIDGQEQKSLEGQPCTQGPRFYAHKLAKDEFLVAGDNHRVSLDSRFIFCNSSENFYVNTNSVKMFGTVAGKL